MEDTHIKVFIKTLFSEESSNKDLNHSNSGSHIVPRILRRNNWLSLVKKNRKPLKRLKIKFILSSTHLICVISIYQFHLCLENGSSKFKINKK